MKILFTSILALLFFAVSCNTKSISYIPAKYTGNWFDVEGEDYWKYSLQQDFIIADNNFWYAEKIKEKENSLFLSLSNGSSKKELHIEYLSDSIVKIQNKIFTQNFSTIQRRLNNQQLSLKGGAATILGYIDNFQQYYDSVDRVQFIVNDFVLNEQIRHYAIIDSISGRFEISIDLNGPQDVFFRYKPNSSLSKLFLHPSDTLIMYINVALDDSQEDNIQFMGKYADACYDIYRMQNLYNAYMPPYEENRKALGKEPEEYHQFRKGFHEKQLEFLEQYCSANQCSETFKLWFLKNAEVEYFRELMNYSWKGAFRLTGQLKEDYEKLFMDDINLNDSLYWIFRRC